MLLTANIIGGTGLVGQQLIRQLIKHPQFSVIRLFTRRSINLTHPKLEEHLVDFEQSEEWSHRITGDVLFSTLGTTIKKAGSKENQYRIDYTYQYQFARAGAENGVPVLVLVSSAGANSRSLFFYNRMKGELEQAVKALPFQRVSILQPSILDGLRNEKRRAETAALVIMQFMARFALKKYRPINDSTVAAAMINAALRKNTGTETFVLDELFDLAFCNHSEANP